MYQISPIKIYRTENVSCLHKHSAICWYLNPYAHAADVLRGGGGEARNGLRQSKQAAAAALAPGQCCRLPLPPTPTAPHRADGLCWDLTQVPLATAGWLGTASLCSSFLLVKEKGGSPSLPPAPAQRWRVRLAPVRVMAGWWQPWGQMQPGTPQPVLEPPSLHRCPAAGESGPPCSSLAAPTLRCQPCSIRSARPHPPSPLPSSLCSASVCVSVCLSPGPHPSATGQAVSPLPGDGHQPFAFQPARTEPEFILEC